MLTQEKMTVELSETAEIVAGSYYQPQTLAMPYNEYSELANAVNGKCRHLIEQLPVGTRIRLTLKLEQLPFVEPEPTPAETTWQPEAETSESQ
jgi:hypothetical protein